MPTVTGPVKQTQVYIYSDGTPSLQFGPFEYTAVDTASYAERSPKDVTPFKPGEFKVTEYSVSRSVYTAGNGQIKLYAPYPYGPPLKATMDSWSGVLGNWCFPSDGFTSLLDDPFLLENYKRRALQRAYAKVGKAQLELGTELGEIKETLEFLRSPFKKLRDFYTVPVIAVKNGKGLSKADIVWGSGYGGKSGVMRELEKAGKVAADTWMEWRYALRPLIMTIQDIIEELERKKRMLDLSRIRSVGSTKSYTADIEIPRYEASRYVIPGVDQTTFGILKRKYSIRAKVFYRNLAPRGFADTYGLTPRFIPEIAWELTSKSFVLDWVLSVGSWLGSYRVNPSIEILGDTISVKREFRGNVKHMFQPVTDGQKLTGYCSDSTYLQDSYDRQINQGRPYLPTFTGLDTWDVPKTVDSLAMLLRPVLQKCKELRRK